MSVTIKDVAKAANVSIASASRAMNGHGSVSPEVRRRVDEAARQLRYVPHSGARSLITRRTQTLGVVLPDLHGEFFSELIRGIDQRARADRMHVLVSSSHGDAEEAVAAIRTMRGRVDGLLVMSPHLDAGVLREHLPPSVPVVLMNTPEQARDAETCDAISIDNYAGARAMVEHLAERGCRRIALIGGPAANYDAQERLRGYQDALATCLPGVEEIVVEGDFSEQSGYRAGQFLIGQSPRPDAIFAANDMMAIGCLFALGEAGIDVPGSIALAGFDDIPIARFVAPPLSTVRVRIADLGQQAAGALLRALQAEGQHQTASLTLPVELVARESTNRKTLSR
jgi:LacI family transcriptional regulator